MTQRMALVPVEATDKLMLAIDYAQGDADKLWQAYLAVSPNGGKVSREQFEHLAALEHDQWAHWVTYMLANLGSANIERWRQQARRHYTELSEEEKQSDREFAEISLRALGLEIEGLRLTRDFQSAKQDKKEIATLKKRLEGRLYLT